MPSFKLMYFDMRGRGECIRMLFATAGVAFEDVRVKKEDWPALKPKMPLGKLPVLEVDGKMLPETRAIQYYVAKECELYGSNAWEAAWIDVVGELLFDLMKPLVETVAFEKDEKKKMENAIKYYTVTAPLILETLEGGLKRHKGGDEFFVGDKISLADISFLSCMDWFLAKGQEAALDKYPKLKALKARVASNKNLAAYLAKRPPSDM